MSLTPIGGNLVPGTTSDWLNSQDSQRMSRYRQYLDFYQGLQWPTRRRRGETRITANYARTLVRKAASYVFPEPVTFSVQVGDNQGATEAACAASELVLNELYRELDLASLDFETLVDSSVLGDGAFKVTWDVANDRPLVTAVDPAGLWAWARPDNVRELARVIQRYQLYAYEAAELFQIAGLTGTGVVNVIETWTRDRYTVEVSNQVAADEANPYGWIPYVLFPNLSRPHELWGDSDLADLLDVCGELNRRLTVLARILQVSGNPIVVLEGVDGAEGIRADEGAVWQLPAEAKAYLLDMLSGGGVGLHIQYVEQLYRAIHDLAETPRTAFGDTSGSGSLSGVALEVELQPLIQKVQRKRRVWDRVYRQRNAMVLQLLNRFGGGSYTALNSRAVWPEILPSDRDAAVANEVALVAAQVHSRETAMVNLGEVDAEREWARIRAEAAEISAAQPTPAQQQPQPQQPAQQAGGS